MLSGLTRYQDQFLKVQSVFLLAEFHMSYFFLVCSTCKWNSIRPLVNSIFLRHWYHFVKCNKYNEIHWIVGKLNVYTKHVMKMFLWLLWPGKLIQFYTRSIYLLTTSADFNRSTFPPKLFLFRLSYIWMSALVQTLRTYWILNI